MLPGRPDLRQKRAASRSSSEPAVGGDQDGIEGVGCYEVAGVVDADAACEGSTKRVANQHVESNDVERQSQNAIECPVRLVSADLSPANRDRECVGHLSIREFRHESSDASRDNGFDPCRPGRVVLSEHAPDEGARVKDGASGRSHGPVE
jgi:hypothetical protein